MDIQTVLISLTTSVFTVLGGKAWDTYKEFTAANKEIQYLATKLAYLFDEYASLCAEMLCDHENYRLSIGQIGVRLKQIPEFPVIPNENECKKLKLYIFTDILEFPQHVKAARKAISGYYEVMASDELTYKTLTYTLEAGISAVNIAERIRKSYRLPPKSPELGRYNAMEYFDEMTKIIPKAYKPSTKQPQSGDLTSITG